MGAKLSTFERIVAVLSFAMCTSCMQGPKMFGQEGDAAIPEVKLKVTDAGDGVFTANLSADSALAQTMQYADGSSITFPPGSLAISSTISIEPGSTLAGAATASSVGATSLTQASSAYVVSASSGVDASSPFTISLGIGGTSLRLNNSGDPYAYLVVIYKIINQSDGRNYVGFLPRSAISIVNGKAKFETRFFGAYQLAYADTILTEAKSVETETPILTKREAKKLPAITWSIGYAAIDRSIDAAVVSATASGFATLVACSADVDQDKIAPFHLSRAADNFISVKVRSEDFPEDEGPEVTYYVRFHCSDDTGRSESSEWAVLFDPNNDPRSHDGDGGNSNGGPSNFNFLGASPNGGTIARNASLNLTWNETVEVNSFSSNFSVTNNMAGGAPVAWTPTFNNEVTSIAGAGGWPVNAPLTVNIPGTISGQSGALQNSTSFQLHTAAGGLATAAKVAGPDSNQRAHLASAVSKSGKAVVAWLKYDGSSLWNMYASYGNSDGLGDTFNGSDAWPAPPQICTTDDGKAVVAWLNNAGTSIMYRTHNGTQWHTTESEISAIGNPVVACGPTQAWILWENYDGSAYYAVKSAKLLFDGTETISFASLETLPRKSSFSLALQSDNEGMLVWIEDNNVKARRMKNGVWEDSGNPNYLPIIDLLNTDPVSGGFLQVVASADRYQALWQELGSGPTYKVMTTGYVANAWATPAPLDTASSYFSGLQLAASESGNFMSAWRKDDAKVWWAASSGTNTIWSAASDLGATSIGTLTDLGLKTSRSGRAVMAFRSGMDMRVAYYNGSSWGMSTYTAGGRCLALTNRA